MINLVEIAWIAGLLEGEGSFLYRNGPTIQVTMTDKDIVQRAACLVNHKLKLYERDRGKYKRSYSLRINGYRAIAWMLTIYSFMGVRRQEKIREVIAKWKEYNKNVPRALRGESRPKIYASCHPTRLRYFKMICRECWMRAHNEREARKARLKRAQRIRCTETAELFK